MRSKASARINAETATAADTRRSFPGSGISARTEPGSGMWKDRGRLWLPAVVQPKNPDRLGEERYGLTEHPRGVRVARVSAASPRASALTLLTASRSRSVARYPKTQTRGTSTQSQRM